MINREFKKLLLMMMMMMMMMMLIKVLKHLSTITLSSIGDMWVQLQSFILGTEFFHISTTLLIKKKSPFLFEQEAAQVQESSWIGR